MLKVYNSLFRQPAQPIQVDLSTNTLWYGSDNAFPLKLATLVQESPAASSCISILSDYLEGIGFSDATLKDKIINSQGQRFGDLHSEICDSFAMFEGFVLLCKYTREGKIAEIYNVPFENVRLQKPDDAGVISKVLLNPYFGTAIYQKQYDREYYTFNPDPKVVLSQIAKCQKGTKNTYEGQILYVAKTRPLSRFYPQPYYFSAQHWMAIDAGISKYHANNLEAGFFQTLLLKMVGNPDEPSTHPDDQETNSDGERQSMRTRGERFEIEMQKFVGADSKTKMMVLWEQMKEQFPELQAFPTSTNENFFSTLQELTTKNIVIATKIPAILANISKDNSLSDGTQLANATKVMHDRVAKPQNLLERTYMRLLNNFKEPYTQEIKILNANSFEGLAKIDPLAWAELTPQERRKWIKENTEFSIEEDLQATGPINKFQNIMFTDYPEAARKNAARAMEHMANNAGCGKPFGKQLCQDIIDGKPLTFKNIKKIYTYLKNNQQHENKLFSDSCEPVLFHSWGGRPMLDYCADKIKMINE